MFQGAQLAKTCAAFEPTLTLLLVVANSAVRNAP
jgi:hypothetical protein